MANGHGEIDHHVPEADQWCEVVEDVLCIHHIWQDAAKHVQADQNCSTATERIVSFLVEKDGVTKAAQEKVRGY